MGNKWWVTMLASTVRRAVQTNVRRGIPAASSSRGFVSASDNATLSVADPEMYALLMAEKKRQQSCLELILGEFHLTGCDGDFGLLSHQQVRGRSDRQQVLRRYRGCGQSRRSMPAEGA